MTVRDMIDAADRARHEGRHEDATQWAALYHIIARIEAAARIACAAPDPYQLDRDEYDEEMSLGGQVFRS